MSMTPFLLAPLAAIALNSDDPQSQPGDAHGASERFAKALVTSYSCELLGYGVDYDGLARWGDRTQRLLMADGYDEKSALLLIRSDVEAQRYRFNAYQGRFLQGVGTLNRVAINLFDEDQFRFQKSFTKNCNRLAQSPETQRYFTPPQERLSGAELSRKIRELYINRVGL